MGKIVYTYGVFDLLHVGHLELLKEAKALGDELIVGVFTDKVAESFKRKPIIPGEQRMEMLKNLSMVDKVVYQENISPFMNSLVLKPDIIAKGPGANWEELMKEPNMWVMETVLLPYHDGQSTSNIIKQIKE